ncbi:GHKL domain-containing protein [Clostridium sp. 19966]|uniref:sensor histidine kinase n=1 Tax=Clostridium sp. 19966 TaxID=2768166 RepID=UPI0028DFF070|nr:ATP-binding protein [Clostridium sp. 19966]MDT8715171.1 GHKL domain-containing protein [Clostridium sp. 19966]
MIITIADTLNTLLQSILFVYIANCCVSKKYRINKFILILTIVLLLCGMTLLTPLLGNLSINIIIVHVFILSVLCLVYRNDISSALIAFTLIYISVGINVLIFGNIFFRYFQNLFSSKYTEILMVSVIYIPQFIVFILIIYFRSFIVNISHSIRISKYPIAMILIASFTMDFMVSFYSISFSDHNYISKNIIICGAFIFFIMSIIYFAKIQAKSIEISNLNTSLDYKVTELRKIKHDFGTQISYLYGLYLMNRFDDLGKSLKAIIDDTSNVPSGSQVYQAEIKNSFFTSIIKDITSSGINAILNEDGDLSLIEIPEYELHRIISNIISNAVNAMNGKGIIIIKTYTSLKNLTIKIQNNGPMIPEKNINRIFEVGYTTKENKNGDHGFGLSIVKDLVEKYGGSISVKSTKENTEFKLVFPLK